MELIEPKVEQAKTRSVELKLVFNPRLNYAAQQNSVPTVSYLELRNSGSEALENLTVKLYLEPDITVEPLQLELEQLAPGELFCKDVIDLKLALSKLSTQYEREKVYLHIQVSAGDEALFRRSHEIELLAYNEWGGSNIAPELLAAFSQPNNPALSPLVAEAQERLMSWSNDSALSGYQSKSRERVRLSVAAFYAAVQARGISYIGASPSFESQGQKIRTAEQLLSEGRGNCLDLTLLLASSLELSGLHPILILVEGHAFPGVWLEDDSFDTMIVDDPLSIRKRVEVGSICVFDSSIMTVQPAVDFAVAEKTAIDNLGEKFQFAVDIHCARSHRILPLPSRNVNAEFVVESETRGATVTQAPASYPALTFATDEVGDSAKHAEPAERRLQRWKEKLLDLSMRNRLLNFRPSAQTLPLQVADISELEDILAGGKRLRLYPKLAAHERGRDSELHKKRTGEDLLKEKLSEALVRKRLHTALTPDELDNRLLKIWRESRTVQEETGTSTLFLALGFLQWYESTSSETPRMAPIILLPVELTRGAASEGYKVSLTDDEARLNVTLLEKLRADFNLTISGLNELPEDASGLDIPKILHTVRRQILEMPRWQVVEQASLGPFSFTKFLLWRDLEARSEALKKNEVVARLIDPGRHSFQLAEFISSKDIDNARSPQECLCPLDADSSQLAAVYASEGSASFVLQGPPGTGKSQTITNIIAHTLGQGKTVLFVAEKLAALNVVRQRLENVGLGPFCLELHSNKARKSDVIRQLNEALVVPKEAPPEGWNDRLGELEALRRQLNGYAERLHHVYPLGMTIFEVTSRLIGLQDVPYFPSSLECELTSARLKSTQEAALAWEQASYEVGPVSEHPLREWLVSDWSPNVEDALAAALRTTELALKELNLTWESVREKLSVERWNASVADLSALTHIGDSFAESPGAPPKLLVESGWKLARQTVEEWANKIDDGNRLHSELDTIFQVDRLQALPLDNIIETYEKAEKSAGWLAWFQTFSARRRLSQTARASLPERPVTLVLLRKAKRMTELYAGIESVDSQAGEWLGLLWKGKDTDLANLRRHLEWIDRFRNQLIWLEDRLGPEGEKTRSQVARWSEEPTTRVTLFENFAKAFRTFRMEQDKLLTLSETQACTQEETLATLQQCLERWSGGLRRLRDWTTFVTCRQNLEKLGLKTLVESYNRGAIASQSLVRACERSLLETWHRERMETDILLRQFRGASHELTIERFRKADELSLKLVRSIVRARLAERIPAPGSAVAPSSESGILQREIKKKTRHLPCRQLFAQLPNLLPVLKPCVMMSPLSVAQYLDPERTNFDLVIFDEASQITVWDAIGSLARGRKAIVVGDSRQLPPTNFFSVADKEDETADEYAIEDLESILEEAVACGMPEHRLRWHYRSRHESLITFSNVQYYEGDLLTFPSSVDRHPNFGVTLHHVPGVYDRGASRTNRAEAEAIVRAVVDRLKDPELRGQSIGVVTFNSQQQTLIEDLLDAARSENREIEPYFTKAVEEPVFVKNLENVQGDERDVMFFSTTFGMDAAGKMTMNFGAVTKTGGERRLNVAITRARESLEVYASIRPEQIDLNRTRSLGARHLREFLDYARRGPIALMSTGIVKSRAEFDSPFEEQVAAALTNLGWKVHPQVGSLGYRIDLGIESTARPGTFLAGVECDGATYHSARCARDRDRLREAVLRQLGWNIVRVWSTDWWHDPAKETARLHKSLQEFEVVFAESGVAQPATTNVPKAIANEFDSVEEESPLRNFSSAEIAREPLPGTTPYVIPSYDFSPLPSEWMYEHGQRANIRERLVRITAAEEPITLTLAARTVLSSYGMAKLTSKAKAYITSIAQAAPELVLVDDVLWLTDSNREDWSGVRVPEGSSAVKRNVDDIPLCELENGAQLVLKQNLSMPKADLARETAKVFGIARLGTNVASRLDEAIGRLISSGRAQLQDDSVSLSS